MPKNKRKQQQIGQAVAAGLSSGSAAGLTPSTPGQPKPTQGALDTGHNRPSFPTLPNKGPGVSKGGPVPDANKIRQGVTGDRGRLKTLKALDPAERSEKQVARLTSLRTNLAPLRAARVNSPKLFPGGSDKGNMQGNATGGVKPPKQPLQGQLGADWRRKRR